MRGGGGGEGTPQRLAQAMRPPEPPCSTPSVEGVWNFEMKHKWFE